MAIYLASNSGSINSLRNLGVATSSLSKSLEKLSSGYKINRASDGAAGLLISENLRSQIRGADVASSNVQQGLSMLQSADTALQQVYSHLQDMRDIAVAASNGTTTTAQYATYEADYLAHYDAIDNILSNAKYGSLSLFGGIEVNIQIGPNASDQLDISNAFASTTADNIGLGAAPTLTDASDAQNAIGDVDGAMDAVAGLLATIGSFENTMENQMNYLSIYKENATAAEASIRNTDVAQETANVARLQILQQAAAYALAQANNMPALALRLLQ